MAADMDVFEKTFCGVWKHDRDENLVEAMKKMEYPDEETKVYCSMKPTIMFERRGDAVYMAFEMAPKVTHDCLFKFGEEFESKDQTTDPPNFHNKEMTSFCNGVLTFKAKSQLAGGKDTHSDFIVKDGELHTLMSPLGDTSFNGNRIYKRVK